ncbi:MAG: CvpA family protein [Terrimicrobiaceae bacterium]|nr:CvpA family protein [Terrimicrobiaceae bacterium]
MNPSEISILLIAVLPILYRGWSGWQHGAAIETRHLLVNLFAILVAIRYWQPWTELISRGLTFDPRWIAAGSFVALYFVGAAVAGVVVKMKAPAYQSVKSDFPNHALGLATGAFTGALAGACVLWLATVAMPGKFDSFAPAQSFASLPRDVFQALETRVAGVEPGSAARTRYPQVTMKEAVVDPKAGDATPDGVVLMQMRGQVTWQ